MKKKYETPELEEILVGSEDIICTSNMNREEDELDRA